MIPRTDRRRLGIGLFAFGATGVALVLAALVLVLGSLAAIDDAASGFERQRAEAVAMLGPASTALSHAASSASNASGSLTQASSAADRAALLTTRLAESFEGLAALGGFEIFGARPFAGLDQQFGGVASDARAVSADLGATAASLRANVVDAQAVGSDLRALAAQLDRLEASLGGPSSASSASAAATDMHLPILGAKIVVLGLLGWMAVPALASCWLGWRLARRRRS
ncbi:MAG: hypothetical protein ABI620_02955 [Chloroflexota bacterium]